MTPHPRCLAPEKRCVLSFRGPDAERYLNGQLTQDVRHLGDRALPACVTDAKGRLQAFVHVFRGPEDAIWVEGPVEQEDELEPRLTRYLIADDVEVATISSDWQLVHAIDGWSRPVPAGGFTRSASRASHEGTDLWLPVGTGVEIDAIPDAETETRRIHARIPAWGRELTAGMLPPEAGLDRNAISYHKGCYIGQEVLSRIKTAGRLNRKLAAFLVNPGTEPGTSLTDGTGNSGNLTSIAPWPDESGLHAALGYLDKSAFQATELYLASNSGSAKVLGFV
jgi:tRNA-modifying protein YgfZ